MDALMEAVTNMAWLQREVFREPDLWEVHYRKFIPALIDAAVADPEGAWRIFQNGTDEEFATLVNFIGSIGKPFETGDARRKIMRLAKQRGTQLVLDETKAGFGKSFDRFWNETGP